MHDTVFLQLALVLAAAKLGGEACERWLKVPAVLGEIVAGAVLGIGALGWLDPSQSVLMAVAEIGAVFLLFEVGLESDLDELFSVGGSALAVALIGVALPFGLGYGLCLAMGMTALKAIFVGAALTATSVGITARVFADLGALKSRAAKIVLGAAVADDVVGLIMLAAVSGLQPGKSFSWGGIAQLSVVAIGFVLAAVFLGLKVCPMLLRWVRLFRARSAMSVAAVAFCMLVAGLASTVSLAPIVGAFCAGLVLSKAEQKIHFEQKVKSIADVFVPTFFVMMGANMDLRLFDPSSLNGRANLLFGLALCAVAVVGKVASGAVVRGSIKEKLVIGCGMIPRGEVGLIFASLGLAAGTLDQASYASLVFVVLATTFAAPPLLAWLIKGRTSSGPIPVPA